MERKAVRFTFKPAAIAAQFMAARKLATKKASKIFLTVQELAAPVHAKLKNEMTYKFKDALQRMDILRSEIVKKWVKSTLYICSVGKNAMLRFCRMN